MVGTSFFPGGPGGVVSGGVEVGAVLAGEDGDVADGVVVDVVDVRLVGDVVLEIFSPETCR